MQAGLTPPSAGPKQGRRPWIVRVAPCDCEGPHVGWVAGEGVRGMPRETEPPTGRLWLWRWGEGP